MSFVNRKELDLLIIQNLFKSYQVVDNLKSTFDECMMKTNEVYIGEGIDSDNYLVDIGKFILF